MKLLVGLGNPGTPYQHSRHNLGQDLLEAVIRQFNLSAGGKRFHGQCGDGRIDGERIVWLIPETYMNLSGEAVGAAARYFRIPVEEIIVLHDDVDLACGKVRMKIGGGNGGHNGLKSIQQILGSPNFIRIRLGVGRPPAGMDTARFVLAGFTPEEQSYRLGLLEHLPQVMPMIVRNDLNGAMNRFNHLSTISQPSQS
ncbi:MAG: aminoacyl-tRNA hydrolase [Magnetococcales bacterium]|nr:aminoacyl-tRNA hydrolase [Magnetococcales bacterium]NGZ05312.1 aminoacyl-tRNA hydrolase [Magnetococcales bacterium]